MIPQDAIKRGGVVTVSQLITCSRSQFIAQLVASLLQSLSPLTLRLSLNQGRLFGLNQQSYPFTVLYSHLVLGLLCCNNASAQLIVLQLQLVGGAGSCDIAQ